MPVTAADAMISPLHRTADGQASRLERFVASGIAHCRSGRWELGARYLAPSAERLAGGAARAGLHLSFLGCALARVESRVEEGLALCQYAVGVEFYQPENWANLAEVLLLAGRRREAIAAIRQGLQIDPAEPRLCRLHRDMGLRRPPLLGFLSRANPLNRVLGTVRSQLAGRPDSGA